MVTQNCVAEVLEFQSDTGGVGRDFYILAPKVFKNSSPARVQWLDSNSRTQATRVGMTSGNSRLRTTPTLSPVTSASLVRTFAPCWEMSTVIAESSALELWGFNTRLIGIVTGRRSHRRGVWEAFVCNGSHSSLLGQTTVNEMMPGAEMLSSTSSFRRGVLPCRSLEVR